VLVGGASTRFGSDKSRAVLGGESLIDRALHTLREAGATRLAYVGGPPRTDAGLPAQHVADNETLAACMLRGIVAALAHAEHIGADRALIIACDLPLLRAASARALLSALDDEHVDVAVARGEQDHWSCIAIRSGMGAPLRESLAHGELAVHRADCQRHRWRANCPSRDRRARTHQHERRCDAARHHRCRSTAWVAWGAVPIREISASDLATIIERGGAVVDVREPDEYREGHVPGAKLVPLGAVPESLEAFRKSVPVYVICRSGARSMRACEFLHEAGITNVVNVAGGTVGFAALGHELSTGDQA